MHIHKARVISYACPKVSSCKQVSSINSAKQSCMTEHVCYYIRNRVSHQLCVSEGEFM
jgi:hypothetical protein